MRYFCSGPVGVDPICPQPKVVLNIEKCDVPELTLVDLHALILKGEV